MNQKRSKSQPQSRRGRPPLPPEQKKRAPLGFRPTPDTRRNLEEAAARSGRSLSEEIEYRLERSFLGDSLRSEVVSEIYGGSAGHNVLKSMAAAAQAVSEITGKPWLEDPKTFREAKIAMGEILDVFRPGGEVHKRMKSGGAWVEAVATVHETMAANLRGQKTPAQEEAEDRGWARRLVKRGIVR